MTRTALMCAQALEIDLQGVVDIVQGMNTGQFYKSMTSAADSKVWQDVYHVPYDEVVLYVKFTTDVDGYLIISFKEK